MKFAREYKEALLKEGFPPRWVESAVPYGQLKKIIKKVKRELESIGLNPADLAGDGVGFQYKFDGDKEFRPKLTLMFDGTLSVTDATLSSDTRNYLEVLVKERGKRVDRRQSSVSEDGSLVNDSISQASNPASSSDSIQRTGIRNGPESTNDSPRRESTVLEDDSNSLSDFPIRRVEIPLEFDAEFFGLLQDDVTHLDGLQAEEQRAMTEQIMGLSKEMARLAAPSKFAKTDMYQWRALFDVYLQACIFFSTKEQDHGSRKSATSARQLGWFQSEVTRQGLVDAFKLPASRQAFARFIAINITLLQNLKFQEINQKAIGKILKKFDKRTHLGATNSFPKFIQSDAIMSETMAKAVCAQITEDIVKITPQIDDDDYTCPICSTIAWRPIRLSCGHVLCTKCTLELQRTFKYSCPMCRGKLAVKKADEDNVDEELIKKMKKYFPKETKEKRIELETIDGRARFGPDYKHPSEEKCAMM